MRSPRDANNSQFQARSQRSPWCRGRQVRRIARRSRTTPIPNICCSGIVFEKRLILKYIEENGKEPGTDEELDPEDLLAVKTSRVVRPRPPNFTSLPSLLKAFQDEWDALVLETYNTREQLSRTREELATALYQHDAAVRVIARLTKERDEARDALSKVTVAPASVGAANGDAMAVDNESLPDNLVEHVHELQQQYVL